MPTLVRGIAGDGIRIVAQCVNLFICRNTVEFVRRSGLTFDSDVVVQAALIEGNIMQNLCIGREEQDRGCVGVALVNCAYLRFAGNTIRNVATAAQRAPIFVGLAVLGCPHPQVESNDISGVGPADFIGVGLGVILLSFTRAVFNGNRVRRFDVEPQQNSSRWIGVFIGELAVLARLTKNFGFMALRSGWPLHFVNRETSFQLTSKAGKALPARAGSRAMINDNTVEGFGGLEPLAMVRVTDACHVQDNQFDLVQESSAESVVQIQAALAALVSNNRVMRSGDAFCIAVVARKFTVTGNMTTSSIQVNGAPLPPPWDALNVI